MVTNLENNQLNLNDLIGLLYFFMVLYLIERI